MHTKCEWKSNSIVSNSKFGRGYIVALLIHGFVLWLIHGFEPVDISLLTLWLLIVNERHLCVSCWSF